MTNANYWIVTTDWHVVSDGESGILGEITETNALALSRHINAIAPAGVISLGDSKDHYGNEAAVGDELDKYQDNFTDIVTWKATNAGVNATIPILPGNHDEVADYNVDGSNDFSIWDSRYWSTPYHWTVDWTAPKIRFIGIHAYIIHTPEAHNGYFQIDAGERTWLSNELGALPADYKAIICSHPGVLSSFGNEIHADHGGTELLALLAANNTKIAAYICGHRHLPGNNAVQDSITHVVAGGVAYVSGDTNGAYLLLEYLPAANDIKIYLRSAGGFYGVFNPATYTTITLSL